MTWAIVQGDAQAIPLKTTGWQPTCICCLQCDMNRLSSEHATQGQRSGKDLAAKMESSSLEKQSRTSSESRSEEAQELSDLRELSTDIQGKNRGQVLQPDMFNQMDVGERQREQIRAGCNGEVQTHSDEWENIQGTPIDNGEAFESEVRTVGERSSYQRESGRQSNRKSSSVDDGQPCQDPHEKATGHKLVPYPSVPCTVLDIFSGAGTVPLVADKLNRRGIGLELKADYCRMAYDRCYDDAPLLTGNW